MHLSHYNHRPAKNAGKPENAMAITATNAGYLNAYATYGDLFKNNATATDASKSILGNLSATTAQTANSLLTSTGREELSKALDAMKQAGYTSFTFSDIENYRKTLESQFSSTVRSGLTEMGVDPDIEFNLVLDADGNLKVITDHENKAFIERYFADNPEMGDEFKHIQALSNLKKNQSKSPQAASEYTRNLKTNLQAEAVQAFFAATDNGGLDYFSQIAHFGSSGSTAYLLGLNQSV